MRRQVELAEGEDQILGEESQRTELPVSELVHRAVRRCYGPSRRLSWDEVFAHGVQVGSARKPVFPSVRVNSATGDPWMYDPLFDTEDTELLEQEMDMLESNSGRDNGTA